MFASFVAICLKILVFIFTIIAFITFARKKEGSLKQAIIEFAFAVLSAAICIYVEYGFDYISKIFFPNNVDVVSDVDTENVYDSTGEFDEGSNHIHENLSTKKENSIDPSCVEGGSYESVIYCECGEELSRDTFILETLGHNYKKIVTAPTCYNQGFTTFICNRCNDTYISDYADALGHDYEDGICVRCGYSDPDYVKIYDSEEIMKILSDSVVSSSGGYSQYLGADSVSVFAEDRYNCFVINTAVSYNAWNNNIREITFNISELNEINILNIEIGGETGSRGSVKIEFFVDNQFDTIPNYTYELDTAFTPIHASINIEDATLLGIRVTNYANNENRIVFFDFSEEIS